MRQEHIGDLVEAEFGNKEINLATVSKAQIWGKEAPVWGERMGTDRRGLESEIEDVGCGEETLGTLL